MSTSIATTQEPKNMPQIAAGGPVRAIVPQDFESAWRIATAVTTAGMAPAGLETPAKCLIAILHGLEVGLTPMAALQSIAVINGRPNIFGDGALALVRGSGLLESIEEISVDKDGDTIAICRVKRKGEPIVVERKFSQKDAVKALLWGKGGPWTTYPNRMLQMRARAFALRDAFADLLKGLGIREEVEDIPMRDVTPPRDSGPPLLNEATPEVPVQETGRDAGPPLGDEQQVATADDVFDGASWLRDLDGAYSGCEDAASFFEVDTKVFTPNVLRALPPDREKAKAIRDEHYARVVTGTE